jgi:hypothetical protein
MPRRLPCLVLLVALLAAAGCGGDEEENGDTAARTSPPPAEETNATTETESGGATAPGSPPTDTAATTAPGAAEAWAGARPGGPPGTFIRFASELVEPMRVEPANGAMVVGLRWSGWGEEGTTGAGTAEVDSCDPSCAAGGVVRRRGARVTLFDLREGRCRGEPGRFYTRARFEWPRGTDLPPRQTVRLNARCPTA